MEIWVALIALFGTAIGSISGVLIANKLVNYRIGQLEIKVDKHNCVIERMYKVEERCSVIENDVKVANHRIEDLEKESS